jgi:hypothetical protein
MNDLDPTDRGRYRGRDGAGGCRELWWAPPGGAPWERLTPLEGRSPDGPNWGYVGNGPLDAAETILLHATGDPTIASAHAKEFCAAVLAAHSTHRDLEVPAGDVEKWLGPRGIPLAHGWGPLGPQPVVECLRAVDGRERYTVALDGWDLLRVDLAGATAAALVGVTDLKSRHELRWMRPIDVAEPGDGHTPSAPGTRVAVDPLPFGGWAVQVDGFDVAIIEREPPMATHARVAVYDRGPESGFLVFDERVRYRQLPAEPVAIGERLRRFTGTADRGRVLGR